VNPKQYKGTLRVAENKLSESYKSVEKNSEESLPNEEASKNSHVGSKTDTSQPASHCQREIRQHK
jgi:hypothetical protein